MSYQIAKPVSEKPVGLTGSEINDYIFKIKKNTGNIRVQIERIRNSDKDFEAHKKLAKQANLCYDKSCIVSRTITCFNVKHVCVPRIGEKQWQIFH